MKGKVKSDESYFRLSCHETSTLSVKKLRGMLDAWAKQGFAPDVVVIDYADLMPPSRRFEKKIDQIESVWEDLRALSLAKHCCVVTATQSTRPGYNVWLLDKEHVSECKKKIAYVSALIGINQKAEEKERQAYRLNMIKLRSEDFVPTRPVYVAGCLSIAHPCMRSSFG
jgi:replicative DNA helicase